MVVRSAAASLSGSGGALGWYGKARNIPDKYVISSFDCLVFKPRLHFHSKRSLAASSFYVFLDCLLNISVNVFILMLHLFLRPSLHSRSAAWDTSFSILHISDIVDMELQERCFSLVLLPVLVPDVLIYTLVRLKAGKQSRPFASQVFFLFIKSGEKKGKLHPSVWRQPLWKNDFDIPTSILNEAELFALFEKGDTLLWWEE